MAIFSASVDASLDVLKKAVDFVGDIFVPDFPAPIPPPPIPVDKGDTAAAEAAAEAEKERQKKKKGRAATLVTGPQGVSDELGTVTRPEARGATLFGE